jgi:hypothetical protein
MSPWICLLSLLTLAAAAPAPSTAPESPSLEERKALDRDDAAAEAAADRGDVQAALRYMDFFGHEQEEFASAMVEYGRQQRALRRAVTDKFGEQSWQEAASALGVPRHGRKDQRSFRREGDVVYVRNKGSQHDVPYVKVNGVWKVSVRDVLLTGVKARLGKDVKIEEADLHVLAGKLAKVVRQRGKGMAGLAESVRAGRIRTAAALRDAVEALKRPASSKAK